MKYEEVAVVDINENILNKLTDEQRKKVAAAQSPEELLAIAKEAGYEMSPEQLEAVAGGIAWIECPGHGHNCPARCPAV